MAYDVFICYRHDRPNEKDGNVKTAELIQLKLEKLFPGWSVCLDMNVCKDGRFYNKTFPAIQSCRNFVVMLTDGSLDRCKNEDDWVRREILEAFINPCKVILISPDGEMKKLPEDIPDALSALKDVEITSLGVSEKSFDEQIKTLVRDRFVSGGRESDLPNGKVLNIETDYDCLVKSFGRDLIHATVGGDNSIVLPEGRHKMRFVAEGCDSVFEDRVIDTDALRPHDFIEVKLKDRVRKYKEERDGEFEVNGVEFKMIYVEGGRFEMGATAEQGGDACGDEKPAHEVELDDYYIGETVVTQELWEAVMGNNPSYFKGDGNLPVESVSWDDARKFIQELNGMTGKEFGLPTEAQWEYAARGGRQSKGYKYSGSDKIDEVAWYGGNSGGKTHPVKSKMANEVGLYDMSGNVWEWCEDRYGRDYYSKSPVPNPKGPDEGDSRVLRGGSWYSVAGRCRVSYRDYGAPDNRYYYCGFRLVLCP